MKPLNLISDRFLPINLNKIHLYSYLVIHHSPNAVIPQPNINLKKIDCVKIFTELKYRAAF